MFVDAFSVSVSEFYRRKDLQNIFFSINAIAIAITITNTVSIAIIAINTIAVAITIRSTSADGGVKRMHSPLITQFGSGGLNVFDIDIPISPHYTEAGKAFYQQQCQ